jgi:hypothetical protein
LLTYQRELFGPSQSLWVQVQSVNSSTGSVTIGGVDTRQPTSPFTFSWGDGTTSVGFFNQSHTYTATSKNYTVRVTAHYPNNGSDYVEALVRFVPSVITPVPFPASMTVTIPTQAVALGTRQPGYASPTLSFFDDAFFPTAQPRATAEYVFSQAARIEDSILQGDHELVGGAFRQVILRDPNTGGAYSLWFTSPVAVGSGDAFFTGAIGYSSMIHELAHNLSLNAPAAFRYGGKIDGSANAIFSESVAQMFQHAVAFDLVNNASSYGIPADLSGEIAATAKDSMRTLRNAVDNYVAQGKPFSTWNNPATGVDETFGTFMTVAYEFSIHAETVNDYVRPLTRTMKLLRKFNAGLLAQYAPNSNTVSASTFRATLMVAAVSYGFGQDLRVEFRNLGFPIDDATYVSLYNSVP